MDEETKCIVEDWIEQGFMIEHYRHEKGSKVYHPYDSINTEPYWTIRRFSVPRKDGTSMVAQLANVLFRKDKKGEPYVYVTVLWNDTEYMYGEGPDAGCNISVKAFKFKNWHLD